MLSGGEATAMQRRCSRKSAITSGCARWSRRISMGALNESKLFKRKYRPVSAPEVDRQLRVASLFQAGAVHRTARGRLGATRRFRREQPSREATAGQASPSLQNEVG